MLQEEKKINEKALFELARKYEIKEKDAIKIIEKLIEIRKNARMEKNYKFADEIRDDLKKAGILLEDIGKETKWKVL